MVHLGAARGKTARRRVVFALALLWGAVVLTGMRLPYLYTDFAWQIRAYVLFPAFLATSIYFAFVRRQPAGRTRYKDIMESVTITRERIKLLMWAIIGMVCIPAGLDWTSIAIPAWLTKLTAFNSFARTYEVNDVSSWGGALWTRTFELKLVEPVTRGVVYLPLTRSVYEQYNWHEGDRLCARGRTWIFGTIITSSSKDIDGCRIN